jgi:putative glutamine amidotransferase
MISESSRRLRIGLTMRSADAVSYQESRDALAREWWDFLAFAMPEATGLPIPNLGREAPGFAMEWGIDALVLTGGDDIGEAPVRDQTETALIDWCVVTERPVFGVCRGLQMIQRQFGGALAPCASADHVATRHPVKFCGWVGTEADGAEVNSFHTWGIRGDDLAPPLVTFAVSGENWVEGCYHRELPILGVMWHPERGRPFRDLDRCLLRHVFRPAISDSEADRRRHA